MQCSISFESALNKELKYAGQITVWDSHKFSTFNKLKNKASFGEPLHLGGRKWMRKVMGSLVQTLIRSHCSLIRSLQIARVARTLRCAYSLTCLWNESVDSIQLQVVTYNPLCTIQTVQAAHIIAQTAGTARIFTHILISSRRSTFWSVFHSICISS